MEINSTSLKKTARFAGVLYLLFIVLGTYIDFYIPSKIDMTGTPAMVAQNVNSYEFLFRTGVMAHILTNTIWLFLVMVLYRMFRSVNGFQAKLLVVLVIVQIPVAFSMEAINIASLMLFKGELLKTFQLNQRQDLAILFNAVGNYANTTTELFWGLWLFPLAILVYRSRFLPRFLSIWLFINGLAYVVLSFVSLLLPQYEDMAFKVAFPAILGELVFMLWLLIMGAKPPPAEIATK